MKLAGRLMIMGGGLVVVVALAVLPYVTIGGTDETLWDLTTRGPVIETVIAVAAAGLAALGLLGDLLILEVLAAGLSFWLLGQIFPAGAQSYDSTAAGFWLATAASVVMCVGGVLSLLPRGASRASAAAASGAGAAASGTGAATSAGAATAATPPPETAPAATAASSAAPAGWYADPSQGGRERYWSGSAWTEQYR